MYDCGLTGEDNETGGKEIFEKYDGQEFSKINGRHQITDQRSSENRAG